MNHKHNESRSQLAAHVNHRSGGSTIEEHAGCMCEALEDLNSEQLEIRARFFKIVLASGNNSELNEVFNTDAREDSPSDEAILDYVLYQEALDDALESEDALERYEELLPSIESFHDQLGEGGCFHVKEASGGPVLAHDAYHVAFLRESTEKFAEVRALREGLIEEHGLRVPELFE